MPKQIVIAEQHRLAAVFSEEQIQELIVATGTHQVSDIYLGTVENVLPGIDAAFVNLGDSDRNGFMHVTDLGPLRLKRSAASITELVAPKQKVLVQIMKEPTGNKGPRLTGNISLPGRYLVLMPYGRGVNLSRRISREPERHRLRALAVLIKPAGMGLLVRTEAEDVAEEAIIEDLEALQRQWENIQQEAMSARPPALLNRDDDFIQRVLRDVYSADVNRIVTDSHTGLKRVKQHLTAWNGSKMPQGVLVEHHRDRTPILDYFRINAAIRESLKPRVDLPSGGYIIIEPTEALTVIDVNSGSFTRSATARETVLWTNCEAATEIARQLRLRNIAGVIIVDFIDMESHRDKMQMLEQFSQALHADKARPQISQLSELGLVELTRKRQGQNIYELFGRPCSTCGGLGHLVQLPGETGDAHAAVEPAREVSPSATPSLRDARPEPLDPQANLQSLDLINHPSYQERTSRGGRRQRRRRSDGDSGTSSSSTASSSTSRSNGKVDTPVLPTTKSSDKSDQSDKSAEPTPTKATTESGAPETASSSSRGGRSRNGGRGQDKKTGEPEQIAVQMTPEEQRIYALMGISPLVLANQEIKDPKSATVSVVLPGQTLEDEDGPVSLTATAAPASPSLTAAVPVTAPAETPTTPAPTPTPKPDLAAKTATVDTPAPAAAPADEPSAEESEDPPVRRRRRRRSSSTNSASASDDGQ
jgi:ribonuclease E